MKWEKKGFICSHDTLNLDWFKKNTMVPVPKLISADVLRLYVTMCDEDNVGRVGYVDVSTENPSKILGYSRAPAMDIGEDGAFDDSGVLPSALFEHEGKSYLFYSAYQKQTKVPYTILSGVAVASANFETFKRVSTVPILERTDGEMFIRSAVYCVKIAGGFRIYYSSGVAWTRNAVKEVPAYDIKYLESADLFDWTGAKPALAIKLEGDEYGLTTPNVYEEDGLFKMTYAIRSVSKGYRMGYAESKDGREWIRKDEQMQLDVSASGWDSEMVCFGNLFKWKARTYMFYCGNHYGMGGMGYAELIGV
ncbi:MAG: hypothetical protein EOP05_00370 [Proteobacteria bacterium]|nr:MAG: hypothetical protein EOP05_00370 [Pseudomonadota bacterium]